METVDHVMPELQQDHEFVPSIESQVSVHLQNLLDQASGSKQPYPNTSTASAASFGIEGA